MNRSGGGRRPLTLVRAAAVLGGLAAALMILAALALGIGTADLSMGQIWQALRAGGDDVATAILLDIRLPRVILGALAGMALAAAGTTYQAVLRNPLAEPYILGVSGGAALGAILAAAGGVVIPGGTALSRPLGAFAGALLTIAALFRMAALRGRASSYSLILVGVVINSFFSAVILFVVTVADFTRFQGVLFWLAGSLTPQEPWVLALLAASVAAGLAGLGILAPSLNLLTQGEETAGLLGLRVERVRAVALVVASLMTAAVVSLAGLIGFVGLMVPHMTRLALGPDHRLLLPASALAGGCFLLAADALARSAFAPTEIPVGIVTALCGGPFFVWLYRAQGGSGYFD